MTRLKATRTVLIHWCVCVCVCDMYRSKLLSDQGNGESQPPTSLHLLPNSVQVNGMHTVIR